MGCHTERRTVKRGPHRHQGQNMTTACLKARPPALVWNATPTQTEVRVRSLFPKGHGDIASWLFGELNLQPSGRGQLKPRPRHLLWGNECPAGPGPYSSVYEQLLLLIKQDSVINKQAAFLICKGPEALTAILKHKRFIWVRRKSGRYYLHRGRTCLHICCKRRFLLIKAKKKQMFPVWRPPLDEKVTGVSLVRRSKLLRLNSWDSDSRAGTFAERISSNFLFLPAYLILCRMEREEGSAAWRPPRTASLLYIVQLTLVLCNSGQTGKICENWRKEVFACSRSWPLKRCSRIYRNP